MNYYQAIDLLDRRREGADMPDWLVWKALELTGDVEQEYTTEEIAKNELCNSTKMQ